MKKNTKQKFGKIGEDIATKFCIVNGYSIIQNNYYSRFGEIDIIACKNKTLVFIEVKYRSSSIENALHSVSRSKQIKLIKTANIFLNKNPEYQDYFTRFDVIIVLSNKNKTNKIVQLKDAFQINY